MKKLIFVLLAISSCSKEGENHPCYDSTLVHDGRCITHCTGFKGCDGKRIVMNVKQLGME